MKAPYRALPRLSWLIVFSLVACAMEADDGDGAGDNEPEPQIGVHTEALTTQDVGDTSIGRDPTFRYWSDVMLTLKAVDGTRPPDTRALAKLEIENMNGATLNMIKIRWTVTCRYPNGPNFSVIKNYERVQIGRSQRFTQTALCPSSPTLETSTSVHTESNFL